MLLKIRVANPILNKSGYAFPIPEYTDYVGEVAPKPKWVSDDQFCLTTGDINFPFRVIDKDRIICGWHMPQPSTKRGPRVFKVNQYVVTERDGHWGCSCIGFGYRKRCSHIEACKAD